MKNIKLIRSTHICEKILFLDGLTGTGKTMLTSIINSFKRVELGRLEHIYEYLCILDYLKKMDPDASKYMTRMYADLAIYDSMISRETNFRFNDLSGAFSSPGGLKYVKRLFYKDGNVVLDRIQKEKPILHIISHQALGAMDLAFRTFGEQLRVIEMARHPLFLLEHWHSYIDRHGKDSRDFTIWINYKKQALPWFSTGWEEKYIKSTSFDRVIYSIEWLSNKVNEFYTSLNKDRKKQILFIPFEKFVLNPEPYLKAISELLETEITNKTRKALKKQKCPRKVTLAGPAKEIYRRYGWKKPEKDATEKVLIKQKTEYAEKMASKSALEVLEKLSKDYEKKYGLWF